MQFLSLFSFVQRLKHDAATLGIKRQRRVRSIAIANEHHNTVSTSSRAFRLFFTDFQRTLRAIDKHEFEQHQQARLRAFQARAAESEAMNGKRILYGGYHRFLAAYNREHPYMPLSGMRKGERVEMAQQLWHGLDQDMRKVCRW